MRITDKAEKERLASEILNDLPEWFGIPESTAAYIQESREMPFWADFNGDEPTGFIALKETSAYTAEIFVTGVKKRFHRQGTGMRLFDAFYRYAKETGYEFIQVKTVDAGHYEIYDRTRMFYERIGFRKLEVFPELWDAHNPCLVMILSVK
jgi:GNAT superfamily N-acetyltransferase